MSVTARLAELISFDTQNPAGRERPLVDALARELGALGAAQIRVVDVGAHAMVYARFGAAPARLLVNAHVDTVPANAGYTRSPFQAVEREGRLYGLGASDTKGAIAATLEALTLARAAGGAPTGLAVLFSGDEERSGTCLRHFLAEPALSAGLERAIVCEPTGNAVGWRHRGIAAAEATATSPGGHSSRVDHLPNPIAILARAAVALDDMGRRHRDQGPPGFEGICLNVAALDGGLAFNVVPTRATLRVSLRPAPGSDLQALLREAETEARRATAPHELGWTVVNENPSFQTRAPDAFVPLLGEPARRLLDLGFWTEAALLSAAGIDAVVFGPGRIEQAHAADEFVAVAELEAARDTFARLFTQGALPS
jgi:acetylornithine deacetylase